MRLLFWLALVALVAGIVVACVLSYYAAPVDHKPDLGVMAAEGAAAVVSLVASWFALWCAYVGPPRVEGVPPPSILLRSGPRDGDPEPGKLRLHLPLTFLNHGARPGVVTDLKLTIAVAGRSWPADWPGPNDPEKRPEWEPCPLSVPPHGSVQRTVRLYVRAPDDPGDDRKPAEELSEGRLDLGLRAVVQGTERPMWAWAGNVGLKDAEELRRGSGLGKGEAPVWRRIVRDPRG